MPRRRARRSRPTVEESVKPGLTQLFNPYQPIEAIASEALDAIHDASMVILEEIGLEILSEKALACYETAGARVDWDAQQVFIDRNLLMQHIARVPPEFTMHARNPKRNRLIGRNAINFTPVASAPNCSDLEGGRRTGNFADYCNFLRLTHHYDVLDFISGYPVEPIDIHPDTRHLDASLAAYTLTDRAFSLYCLGGGRVVDGIRMAAMARAADLDLQRTRKVRVAGAEKCRSAL